jgi:hypothetical protein
MLLIRRLARDVIGQLGCRLTWASVLSDKRWDEELRQRREASHVVLEEPSGVEMEVCGTALSPDTDDERRQPDSVTGWTRFGMNRGWVEDVGMYTTIANIDLLVLAIFSGAFLVVFTQFIHGKGSICLKLYHIE